jgi:hypothetical protein
MRRVRAVGLATLALAAVLGWSSTGSDAAPSISQLLVFRDRQDPLVLTIEASPLARNAGEFAVRTPDGVYVATGRAKLERHSVNSTHASYQGDATVVTATGVSSAVAVSFDAELDPAHHFAEATLSTPTRRFHLVAPKPKASGQESTLTAFEGAFRVNDWASIYGLLSSDFALDYTKSAFVDAAVAQQSTVGTIVAVTRVTTNAPSTNPAGLTYFTATYDVTRTLGGISRTYRYVVYFVAEGDQWRLWFTAPQ